MASLHRLREHGISTSVNTQIARAVLGELDGILDVVVDAGATNWQLQLTVPMGRASDRPERLLQPHDMLAVVPQLADLYRRAARRAPRGAAADRQQHRLLPPIRRRAARLRFGDDPLPGCNAGINGIGIEIQPRISSDGFVTSHIFSEVSSVTGYVQTFPQISQRVATTQATVRDGEAFVIGGLIQENELRNLDKIPGLGSLPIIGGFFRNRHESRSSTNLYIVVTPHIVQPDGMPPPPLPASRPPR